MQKATLEIQAGAKEQIMSSKQGRESKAGGVLILCSAAPPSKLFNATRKAAKLKCRAKAALLCTNPGPKEGQSSSPGPDGPD